MARIKRGIFFTLDALFACLLIGLALVLVTKYYVSDIEQPQTSYFSQDIINCLSTIKVSEINDTYVQSLITSGEIVYPDNTVIEQIGEFYVLNKTELALNLSKVVSERLIPGKFGFEFLVNQESIYLNDSDTGKRTELISSRRLISGMEKFKPLRGATSKVFLEGIKSKKYSSYLYFGGFVGQGNITQNITDIPDDANITNMELELDIGGDFYLYINGNQCGAKFEPSSTVMTAERWNLTGCIDYLEKGEHNEINITFDDLLNESYIAGGFLRIDYRTEELSPYFEGYKIRYNFPGVFGVVNLYDAFYVPGTLNSMNIYLHFSSDYVTYLTIGNIPVYEAKGNETEQWINLTDENLTSFPVSLNYIDLSNKTVPIRLASYNLSEEVIFGSNADVVLITDKSGSMKARMGQWEFPPEGHAIPNCLPSDIADPNARRLGVAGCLDGQFNEIIMNESTPGNRLWLADFSSDANAFYSPVLSDLNLSLIADEIWNRYKKASAVADGGTCICCALNQAYEIFSTYSNDNRTKAVLLMSDGIPTHCCGTYWSGGWWRCNETGTSLNGEYNPWLCNGNQYDCSVSDCNGPINSSINAAKRLHDDLNVTIYVVGMGPLASCERANYTLTEIAKAGNGTVDISTDGAFLQNIYEEIAYNILATVTQSTQKIEVRGNVSLSNLYPDSYIELEYDPIAEQPAFYEIAVSIEEEKFTSCDPSFTVPSGMRVTDAKVTSYSGHHWADYLSVNGNEVYNLSKYSQNYVRLGDPFFLYVPVNNLVNGTNSLSILTADSPENKTGCSLNNTIIYTGLITSSVSYADVLPFAVGCSWNIEFEDGTSTIINVPENYTGSKVCNYTSTAMGYDLNDSIDSAAFQLFDSLDYDDDGRLYVNIDAYNLRVSAISVQQIPYPWGPAIAEVRVWR
ncbi:hypothetical protein JW930_02710 [Candidatus Woesearchaeota archaeon]|nr:hypothetical protein [Candidatus Woesearchaeota archaeon]